MQPGALQKPVLIWWAPSSHPPLLNRLACPCAWAATDSPFPPRSWRLRQGSHLLPSPRRHCKTHLLSSTPFVGHRRGALQQIWHNLQICAPGLWGPAPKPLPDPFSDHTLTQAQHAYVRHRSQKTTKSSGTTINPLNSACKRWPGCKVWPAGRHRLG
jgi:hypothetical protein